MPIYAIRNEDLIRVNNPELAIVPRDLQGLISPSQWAAICEAMDQSRTNATVISCCCEIVICVALVFPCIFLCHPCLYLLCTQCNMDSKVKSLNASMFNGQPVLSYHSGILNVNTDYLSPPQAAAYTMRTGPVVTNMIHVKVDDTSQVQMASVHGPVTSVDQTGYVEVIASPVAVETRSMYVVIPSNAGPGSVLTVVAPNGTTLSVVCPSDARPGSQILVHY